MGMRLTLPHTYTYLLSKRDGLRGKVDLQSQEGPGAGALADDVEDPSLHHVLPGLHLLPPVVEQLLGVQLLTEGVSVLFQLLSLHVVLPPFAQDGFHALEVGLELAVDLRDGVTQWQTCTIASVLAKELKSGAPPLLRTQFFLMWLKECN